MNEAALLTLLQDFPIDIEGETDWNTNYEEASVINFLYLCLKSMEELSCPTKSERMYVCKIVASLFLTVFANVSALKAEKDRCIARSELILAVAGSVNRGYLST